MLSTAERTAMEIAVKVIEKTCSPEAMAKLGECLKELLIADAYVGKEKKQSKEQAVQKIVRELQPFAF